MNQALLHIDLPLERLASGKVRELFVVDQEHLLFVATDRISAFDVVMPNGIPDKGRILSQMTVFWFDLLADLGPHHLLTADVADFPRVLKPYQDLLRGRSMLVSRCQIVPLEAIVRGYLAGSAWADYRASGSICGVSLPPGLEECAALPEPLFTPSTKAEIGEHDQNISPQEAEQRIGTELLNAISERSRSVYQRAHSYAAERGIILADTKFEFGLRNQQLILADEALTPDSSRFWPAEDYQIGRSQASFDKQYLRDWLRESGFQGDQAQELPESVVQETRTRYLQAFTRLTGRDPDL